MKKLCVKINLLLICACFVSSCSIDDDSYQDVRLRVISEFTGEPVSGAEVLILVQDVGGSGLFSSTYDISRKIVRTDDNGSIDTILKYENTNNFFTIYVIDEEICTDIIAHVNSFFFEEIQSEIPLELKVRKYFPMEVTVKNINPFDENDRISVSFYHVGSNYHSAPLYHIEHRGDVSEPYTTPGVGIDGLQPLWISDNVDSTIFKRVQEGTEARISWTVTRNGEVSTFESEFIPTVQDGVTYYEINF
ncbi:hypothetical protein [uncultured Psychroserpens sp.]|uniref:hypothetical protein n=1 Tax=uncultured Psychroserpens sp. TaxID=255436 RepID=UPI00261FF53E|nr:hypothetical protein [uncultured Psychroserpens sp.]